MDFTLIQQLLLQNNLPVKLRANTGKKITEVQQKFTNVLPFLRFSSKGLKCP